MECQNRQTCSERGRVKYAVHQQRRARRRKNKYKESQRKVEKTQGERKNIHRPASEPVGEEPGTSWTIHTQQTLSVYLLVTERVCITNHTGMRVYKRGVQLRAAAATAGSAIISKSNTGEGREE